MSIYINLVTKLSLEQLIDCSDILSNKIAAIKVKQYTSSSDIKNFVDYHNSLLSEPDVNKFNNELQILELSKTKCGVQNVFKYGFICMYILLHCHFWGADLISNVILK